MFRRVGCRVSSAIAILLQKFFTFTSCVRGDAASRNTGALQIFIFKMKNKINEKKQNGSRNKLVRSLVG